MPLKEQVAARKAQQKPELRRNPEIDAKLDALNTASAALCERLGMRLESTQVDKWHYKGQWATENIYAILDSEWRNRHRPWTRSVS